MTHKINYLELHFHILDSSKIGNLYQARQALRVISVALSPYIFRYLNNRCPSSASLFSVKRSHTGPFVRNRIYRRTFPYCAIDNLSCLMWEFQFVGHRPLLWYSVYSSEHFREWYMCFHNGTSSRNCLVNSLAVVSRWCCMALQNWSWKPWVCLHQWASTAVCPSSLSYPALRTLLLLNYL